MPFVEVFSPPGSPRPEQRQKIAERLVGEVMAGEGAPDNEFARSISWLVWHDLQAMSVGGKPANGTEPPRYVVRVSVPAASLTDEKRDSIVKRVTRVLAEVDDDPDRLYTSPSSFVLLNEVPEGNWGGIGRVVSFNEIASYVINGTLGGLSDDEIKQLLNGGATWEEARR